MAAAQGVELPEDFIEAAKGEGLRKSVLEIFFKLQVLQQLTPTRLLASCDPAKPESLFSA